MTPAEFIVVVSRVRYKPGTTLVVHWVPPFLQMELGLVLVDVENPAGEPLPLRFGAVISEEILSYFSEDRALNWIRERIHEWERHEADEWIAVDGVRRFDPHRLPPAP